MNEMNQYQNIESKYIKNIYFIYSKLSSIMTKIYLKKRKRYFVTKNITSYIMKFVKLLLNFLIYPIFLI